MKSLIIVLAALTLGLAAAPAEKGLKHALDAALDDERKAIALYAAVIEKHGERRPFVNIIDAERRHAAALLKQYERLGLEPPPDRWAHHEFEVPDVFRVVCDEAVVAELENVEMYDELMERIEDEGVRRVFERLRWASLERHLPAFRRHSSGWSEVEKLSPEQERQRERALAAKEELFASLFAELAAAMREGGPEAAVEVCSERAPEIARAVGEKRGVEIGRTSWKLRNPDNTPPVWAKLFVAERPERERHAVDHRGRLGTLLPIRLRANCVACHGATDQLAPGVQARLDEFYPTDEATGFAEGDLRGWFWVETPPAW